MSKLERLDLWRIWVVFVFILFLTSACGREGAIPTQEIAGTSNGAPLERSAAPFEGAFFVGTWEAVWYSAQHTLTIDAYGNVEHSACNAQWKILELEPAGQPDTAKIEVLSSEGYAECPQPGELVCEFEPYLDSGGNQIGVRYACVSGIAAVFQ